LHTLIYGVDYRIGMKKQFKVTYLADGSAEEAKEIAECLNGKVYSRNTKHYTGEWVVRFNTLAEAEEWCQDFDICHWGNRNGIEEVVAK